VEDFNDAIAALLAGGPEAREARWTLQVAGVAAAPSLLATIRDGDLDDVQPVGRALLEIHDVSLLPTMNGLMDDDNPDLCLLAFQWLARCKSSEALDALTEKLHAPEADTNQKSLAAAALGDRRDPGAAEALGAVIDGIGLSSDDASGIADELLTRAPDSFTADLWIKTSVALAKLGVQNTSALMLGLIEYSRRKGPGAAPLRRSATEALQSIVGPGTLRALEDALLGKDTELAERALEGLLYLGAKEAVPAIIPLVGNRPGYYLADIAVTRLHQLTGDWPLSKHEAADLTPQAVGAWWKEREGNFQSGVCYRLGKPLSLETLIGLLDDRVERDYVGAELYVITGEHLGYDDDLPDDEQPEVVDNANRWWRAEGHRFATGALYKYGFEQRLSVAVRKP
jgi:hypothetical protein